MKHLKVLICVLLLASMLSPAIGYSVLCAFNQCYHKSAQQELARQSLSASTKLEFSMADFAKANSGEHEIHYQNKLYDISKINYQGAKVIVFVVEDNEEEQLLAMLEDGMSQLAAMGGKALNHQVWLQFIFQIFQPSSFQWNSRPELHIISFSNTMASAAPGCFRTVLLQPPIFY